MRGNGYSDVRDWAPFMLFGDDVNFDLKKLKVSFIHKLPKRFLENVNGDIKHHVGKHHLQSSHRIVWDSANCITFCIDHYQRRSAQSWITNNSE